MSIVFNFLHHGMYAANQFNLSSGPVLRHQTESSITTTEINDTLLLTHCSECRVC